RSTARWILGAERVVEPDEAGAAIDVEVIVEEGPREHREFAAERRELGLSGRPPGDVVHGLLGVGPGRPAHRRLVAERAEQRGLEAGADRRTARERAADREPIAQVILELDAAIERIVEVLQD